MICGLPGRSPVCRRHGPDWRVARTWAPFEYGYPLDHYLQSLKFSHGRTLGRALGLLLAAWLQRRKDGLAVDVLVPVPLHPKRLHERGYNQAIEIARSVGTELHLPLCVSGVSRRGAAPAQSRLGASARRSNVLHAFSVQRSFAGRSVAIVDDVVTTGATVNALAEALLSAGADRVAAMAVARTVPQGPTAAATLSGTVR